MRLPSLMLIGALGGAALLAHPPWAQASAEEELFTLAAQTFRDEVYGTSVNQLSLFLQQHPHSPNALEAHEMLGRAYYALGDYPKALVELKQALGPEGSPHTVEILYWLGEALLKHREYATARQMFQQVLEQFSTSSYAPFAQYAIAWSFWEAGRWDEALTQFQAVVTTFPDDPLRIEAQFRAGECLVRLNRPSEAVTLLTEFVTVYPVTKYVPQAYDLLGEALVTQRQFESAIAAYEKAIGAAPHGPWAPLAQSGIGFAYFTMQRYRESAEALGHYLEHYPRGPQHDQVRFYQARALIELGRLGEAADLLGQLAQQMPDSSWADDALLWRGELWARQGRPAEAAASYKQLLDRYPSSDLIGDATYALAWAQRQLNDLEGALHHFERAATLGTNRNQQAGALAQAGDLRLQQQAYEEAADHYDRLLQTYHDSAYADYAQFQLGRALTELGRLDAATLAFEALLHRFPESRLRPQALFHSGLLDLQAGQPAAARQRFEAVLRHPGISATLQREARYQIGNCLYHLGQAGEAAKLFRELARTTPASADDVPRLAQYQLGWALYRQGKIPEALRAFHDYLQAYPHSDVGPELALWLAQYYHQHGQPAQALQVLTIMKGRLAHHPALPDLQYWTGRILLALGERRQGIAQLQTLLETAPEHPQAIEGLQALTEAYRHEANPTEFITLVTTLTRTSRSAELQRAAWETLGVLWKTQGQQERAIACFRQALTDAAGPVKARLQYYLASCYEAAGRYEQAVAEYLKVSYLTTDGAWNSQAQFRSAELLEQLGQWHDALKLYEQVAAGRTEEAPPAAEQVARLKRRLQVAP